MDSSPSLGSIFGLMCTVLLHLLSVAVYSALWSWTVQPLLKGCLPGHKYMDCFVCHRPCPLDFNFSDSAPSLSVSCLPGLQFLDLIPSRSADCLPSLLLQGFIPSLTASCLHGLFFLDPTDSFPSHPSRCPPGLLFGILSGEFCTSFLFLALFTLKDKFPLLGFYLPGYNHNTNLLITVLVTSARFYSNVI